MKRSVQRWVPVGVHIENWILACLTDLHITICTGIFVTTRLHTEPIRERIQSGRPGWYILLKGCWKADFYIKCGHKIPFHIEKPFVLWTKVKQTESKYWRRMWGWCKLLKNLARLKLKPGWMVETIGRQGSLCRIGRPKYVFMFCGLYILASVETHFDIWC